MAAGMRERKGEKEEVSTFVDSWLSRIAWQPARVE